MIKFKQVLAGLLLPIAGAASAAANLVGNGDFELPGFESPPPYRYMLDGDNTTVSGWTVSDPTLGLGSTQPALLAHRDGYPLEVLAGTYTLVLTEQAAIRTTFSVLAGANYRLTFLAGVTNPVMGLSVRAAGHTVTLGVTTGLQSIDFTAAATDPAALLEFRNDSPDDGQFRLYWIDSVSVTAVPEPAAVYSMGAGLLLIAALGRLRSRARSIDRARIG